MDSEVTHPLVTEIDLELMEWLKKGRELTHPTMGVMRDNDGKPRMRKLTPQEVMCILKRVGQIEKKGDTEEGGEDAPFDIRATASNRLPQE